MERALMMEVKEAIAKAKAYVREVFEGEEVSELELEETQYDARDDQWRITVSFIRSRAPGRFEGQVMTSVGPAGGKRRLHKVIVFDPKGEVTAMRDRAWMEPAR